MAEINLRKARTIIRKTMEMGHEMGLNPLSVVVVDAGGHAIAFERADGSPPGRFQLAFAKAHGCVMMGKSGSALAAASENIPFAIAAVNGVYNGNFVPTPGGLLVRDKKGAVIGGVGVTGDVSEKDAEAGLAGITAAGLIGEA